MSFGGVQESKKHGGAHEKSADPCLSVPERFMESATLSGSENSVADGERNQDGVSKIHDNEESGLGENLPFLPELGTDCLYSYETAVVENNTEWLKARCKNWSQVEIDIGNQTTSDEVLEFPGISIDSKAILQNCDHVGSLSQEERILPLKTESNISQGNGHVTPYLSLPGPEDIDGDSNSVAVNTLEQVIRSTVGVSSEEKSSVQTIPLSDFNISDTKLHVKDGVLSVIPQVAQVISSNTLENVQWQSATVSSQSVSDTPQKQDMILLTSPNTQTAGSSGNIGENLALTTISIATDKMSNLTKILVNSSQGQQLYHLNISDLIKIQNGNNGARDMNKGVTVISSPIQASPVASQNLIFLPVQNGSNSGVFAAASQPTITIKPLSVKDKIKPEKMFACCYPQCNKLFQSPTKLQVHNLSHSGDRPYKCSEPGCDWAFTKAYKLKRHEDSHKGIKDFVCDQCNKKFTTIYNLRTHSKQHTRPCTEECPVGGCEKKFQTRRELDRHMKTHEGVEKTYKCPYEGCDKLFLSPYCLGSHPRVHQSEQEDLVCHFEGCGRKFDKMCRLKQHERVHTGERPYVCHFAGCNWAFSTASKLTRHMTKHTNKRSWVCKECGKGFLRSEHLKGHMITHSGMKPFECPVADCGQKFVSKSSVYVHIKKHEKAKTLTLTDGKSVTYHCPMEACDKKYNSKSKLRQHMLKHFPGTSKPADAAFIEIKPLFQGGDPARPGNKTTLVQPLSVAVKTAQDGSVTNIDPLEFMASTVDVKDTLACTDIKDALGVPTDATQNHFTAELTAELTSVMANSIPDIEEVGQPSLLEPLRTEPEKSIFPKPGSKKESKISERMGSARTDFHSNTMLSERARKRRRLLRDKAEGRLSSEDLSVNQSDDVSAATSSSQLSSHGITFRDPSTGVLYVQMQLLQDDPPHPDLYPEDSVLNGHLDMSHNSVESGDDHEHHTSDFVGSTINLQDLV